MARNYELIQDFLTSNSIEFDRDVDLSGKVWIRMGGRVEFFVKPNNKQQLECLALFLTREGIRFQVFGNTSNCYFSAGHHGCIVCTNRMRGIAFDESSGLLEADAGASLTQLARKTAKLGWAGLEGLVGVPATVGGAVYMNAGSYGNEISQIFQDATYIDPNGNIRTVDSEAMSYSRRSSAFQRGELKGVILSARFQLKKGNAEKLLKRIEEVTEHRNTYQEKNHTNLGTLCCSAFYRDIYKANPLFLVCFGPYFSLKRAYQLLIKRLFGIPFQATRTAEDRLIKYWFKYPLSRRVHSEFSLNCFISTYAEPGDFEVYTDWIRKISKGRVVFENEYIEAEISDCQEVPID